MGTYRRERAPIVSVIIVGWNKLDTTQTCLATVRRMTTRTPHEIVYVDNGSTDAAKFLDRNTDITFLRLPFNHGFCRGANVGLMYALLTETPYILLLNNDTRIPEDDDTWLERMIQVANSDSKIGAVGAVSNNVFGYQRRETKRENSVTLAPSLIGFCLLLKREAVEQVGLLDEAFEPGNYDDFDYSIRLHKAGWKLAIAESVWIEHEMHASFKELSKQEDFGELLETNHRKLYAKWGKQELAQVGLT